MGKAGSGGQRRKRRKRKEKSRELRFRRRSFVLRSSFLRGLVGSFDSPSTHPSHLFESREKNIQRFIPPSTSPNEPKLDPSLPQLIPSSSSSSPFSLHPLHSPRLKNSPTSPKLDQRHSPGPTILLLVPIPRSLLRHNPRRAIHVEQRKSWQEIRERKLVAQIGRSISWTS